MKIIVTGGRDFVGVLLVNRLLDALAPSVLVVGDCPTGADLFAREWVAKAKERRLRIPNRDEYMAAVSPALIVYRADWEAAKAKGNVRAAGPIRNARMVRENRDAAFLLAFKGGTGTADCIAKAHAEGVPVLHVGSYAWRKP